MSVAWAKARIPTSNAQVRALPNADIAPSGRLAKTPHGVFCRRKGDDFCSKPQSVAISGAEAATVINIALNTAGLHPVQLYFPIAGQPGYKLAVSFCRLRS